MVTRLLFFNTIFFLSFNAHSQYRISKKDSIEIMSVMTFQENAWNIGDLNSFMMGYHNSDELVFSGKNGPTYGWNNIKQRYLNSYPNAEIMGKLSFYVKKIRLVSENSCLLYTSPSPRDPKTSRMPSSA